MARRRLRRVPLDRPAPARSHARRARAPRSTTGSTSTRDVNAHLMRVAQRSRAAQTDAFAPARIGLIIAGLEVPHTHLHVVPIDGMEDLDFANADASDRPRTCAARGDRSALRCAARRRDRGGGVRCDSRASWRSSPDRPPGIGKAIAPRFAAEGARGRRHRPRRRRGATPSSRAITRRGRRRARSSPPTSATRTRATALVADAAERARRPHRPREQRGGEHRRRARRPGRRADDRARGRRACA